MVYPLHHSLYEDDIHKAVEHRVNSETDQVRI